MAAKKKDPTGNKKAIKEAVELATDGRVSIAYKKDQFTLTYNGRIDTGNIKQHPSAVATAAQRLMK